MARPWNVLRVLWLWHAPALLFFIAIYKCSQCTAPFGEGIAEASAWLGPEASGAVHRFPICLGRFENPGVGVLQSAWGVG